ncbi:hypothetical protein D3C71_813610 [compost metagenome]
MSNITFYYEDTKTVHKVPYMDFLDASAPDFKDSALYRALTNTEFVQLGEYQNNPVVVSKHKCSMDPSSQAFQLIEADYNYLLNWWHNPHRKANTRHGTYIMLYLTNQGYVWKLSDWFFTRILTIPDNLNDLFDFG